MNKENIYIELDDKIISFVNDDNIKEDVEKIVFLLLNEQKINVNEIFISIKSASEEEIKILNEKYRGVPSKTDVLSFPIFDRQELENIITEEDENKKIRQLELGDIIICLGVVEEHAKEYETGLKREMLYMITHGVCHLLGFDHEIEFEKKQMREIEEKILNKIGACKTYE